VTDASCDDLAYIHTESTAAGGRLLGSTVRNRLVPVDKDVGRNKSVTGSYSVGHAHFAQNFMLVVGALARVGLLLCLCWQGSTAWVRETLRSIKV
jgi:hypothetical protein